MSAKQKWRLAFVTLAVAGYPASKGLDALFGEWLWWAAMLAISFAIWAIADMGGRVRAK